MLDAPLEEVSRRVSPTRRRARGRGRPAPGSRWAPTRSSGRPGCSPGSVPTSGDPPGRAPDVPRRAGCAGSPAPRRERQPARPPRGTRRRGRARARSTRSIRSSVSAASPIAVEDEWEVLLVVEPEVDGLERHLGVELDAPGRFAEAERLVAARAADELVGGRRDVVGVVVPAEGVEATGGDGRRPGRRRRPRSARPGASRSRGRRGAGRRRSPRPSPSAGSRGRRRTAVHGAPSSPWMNVFSSRSQGWCSSWSACIEPPKTKTAPYCSSGRGGGVPQARLHSS